MNLTQAELLANKLTSSFPRTGIEPSAWVEQLKPLDHTEADSVTTYVIRNMDKQPTISQFLAEYHRRRQSDVQMTRWKPDPKAISFGQYFTIITNRAGKGDREAIEMLDIWEAYLAKQG